MTEVSHVDLGHCVGRTELKSVCFNPTEWKIKYPEEKASHL